MTLRTDSHIILILKRTARYVKQRNFMDRLSHSEPMSVFVQNINIKWAEVSVYSMPVSDKNAAYQNIADKYDVHFIFDDEKPKLHFYSVPWVEVFAIDSCGGFFPV